MCKENKEVHACTYMYNELTGLAVVLLCDVYVWHSDECYLTLISPEDDKRACAMHICIISA